MAPPEFPTLLLSGLFPPRHSTASRGRIYSRAGWIITPSNDPSDLTDVITRGTIGHVSQPANISHGAPFTSSRMSLSYSSTSTSRDTLQPQSPCDIQHQIPAPESIHEDGVCEGERKPEHTTPYQDRSGKSSYVAG
ncbi:hypothetical protein BP00DRAFT_158111 [Aspergillus indologenus CBS 114.80]|uniref:Uncharacterized protein n=1 Tax=Aspergillus indologenus CBS 114.80 TaxID=1450541 RepID=A0A2V5IDG5_9EURO|nr:hypothetical protein BP00DRAFT_158111 [Aspergillus indologenus CBS 114.80]